MTARITVRWLDDSKLLEGGVEVLPRLSGRGHVWIDVLAPDESALQAVSAAYPLPPLAIEDCLHFPQRPKFDVYDDVTFAIWLLPHVLTGDGIESRELDVFLGPEHLVTVHREELAAVNAVAEDARAYLARGVEWTLHALIDRAVDDVFPVVEELSDELEALEDAMLEQAQPDHLERLHRARRSLVDLHRIVNPEREVVRALARLEAFVAPEAYMYYQDIGDHLARLSDTIDTYREVAAGTMDIYLSSTSNRMNAVMKTLTVVATIFMPLTLISGIYGMNFEYMPELGWRFGYFAVLGVMLTIGIWMIWFFRRRDWW
ncbi:MAG: magnesium/cobalt transporter CorA [Coriobacteriia bacterium]|jgi:magnesium Mg(2+) and cobalt Co(2+) transport protein (corA)